MCNRLGQFEVSGDMLRSHTQEIAAVFALLDLVPVRAEFLFERDCIEYTAFSSKFRLVEPEMTSPRYGFSCMVEAVEDPEDEEILAVVTDMSIRVTSRRFFPHLQFEVKNLNVKEITA